MPAYELYGQEEIDAVVDVLQRKIVHRYSSREARGGIYRAKEFEEAVALAEGMQARYMVIRTEETDEIKFRENPPDRCYYCKTELFGKLGSQRLGNLGVLIAINLVFGFTVPGINNIAHLGGLIMGFGLGLLLAPRFAVEWRWEAAGAQGHVADRQRKSVRLVAALAAAALLFGGWELGNARWQGNAETLRTQAYDALSAGERDTARQLFEQAVAADPGDFRALGAWGLALLGSGNPEGAFTKLKASLEMHFDNAPLMESFAGLGESLERWEEMEPVLRRFVEFYPANTSMSLRLARILARMGKTGEARERLETVLLFDCGNADARQLLEEISHGGA